MTAHHHTCSFRDLAEGWDVPPSVPEVAHAREVIAEIERQLNAPEAEAASLAD